MRFADGKAQYGSNGWRKIPMFCINCGSQNVAKTNEEHPSVLVERGDYDERRGCYSEEFEAVVLQCLDCNEEMIKV